MAKIPQNVNVNLTSGSNTAYVPEGETMQDILERLITTEAVIKEVHWNGAGPGFVALHQYLDEVYGDCEHYIDTVAEHMASNNLYALPQWRVLEFGAFPASVVNEHPRSIRRGILAICEYLTDLTEALDEMLVESNEDRAGEDILSEAHRVFTKHLWLLSNEV